MFKKESVCVLVVLEIKCNIIKVFSKEMRHNLHRGDIFRRRRRRERDINLN